MAQKLWNKEEIQILKDNSINGCKAIAILLNRSIKSINSKARKLRINIKNPNVWSNEEREFLRNNFNQGIEFLQKTLNKNKASITLKAKEMKLYTPKEYFSWTEDDKRTLVENYELFGPAYCSKQINTSFKNIKKKAIELGLKWNGISCLIKQKQKKVCTECNLEKEFSHYHKSSNSKIGIVSRCKECVKRIAREYNESNKCEINERHKIYLRNRRVSDPEWKLLMCLRTKFKTYYSGESFSEQKEALVGCSIEDCRKHLESQWEDWMNWTNHKKGGWEIDHIVPTSLITKGYADKANILFNYRNLQPLRQFNNTQKFDHLQSAKDFLYKKIEKFGNDEIYGELLKIVDIELYKKLQIPI